MKRVLMAMVALALPVAASAQEGQTSGGQSTDSSRLDTFEDNFELGERQRTEQQMSTPEARRVMAAYGQCAAELQPGEARRVLSMDFTQSRYRTALRMLSDDAQRQCARDSVGRGSQMRGANILFAGAMAEALIEAEPAPLNARLAGRGGSGVKSYSASDGVAMCLALSLPDQVGTLFASEPGSADEVAAGASLVEAMPACAQVLGIDAKVEATLPGLRAMIATAAYRLLAPQES